MIYFRGKKQFENKIIGQKKKKIMMNSILNNSLNNLWFENADSFNCYLHLFHKSNLSGD